MDIRLIFIKLNNTFWAWPTLGPEKEIGQKNEAKKETGPNKMGKKIWPKRKKKRKKTGPSF